MENELFIAVAGLLNDRGFRAEYVEDNPSIEVYLEDGSMINFGTSTAFWAGDLHIEEKTGFEYVEDSDEIETYLIAEEENPAIIAGSIFCACQTYLISLKG